MATLLMRLAGPMQSWGTTSRFDQRDTGKEPSKSGVVGLLAAALGIERDEWAPLEPLARMKMGVRHDRPGVPKKDYQTAGCARGEVVMKADGSLSKDGVVSTRHYLADAVFLVGLESDDMGLLGKIHASLRDPVWPIALGRKSYVPSMPVWLSDGFRDKTLREAMTAYPWLGTGDTPEKVLYSWESEDGTGAMRMDQPLSSFAERRFGSRFVFSEWLTLDDKEAVHAPV